MFIVASPPHTPCFPASGSITLDINGDHARSDYRVLSKCGVHASLVQFITYTGRKHQVRIHAASGLHTPILGLCRACSWLCACFSQTNPACFASISGDDEHSSKPVPAYVWAALAGRGSAHTKLHLHAHTVTLPPFGPGEAGVHLVAPLPQHFKTALSALSLTLPEVTSPARKRRWFRQQDKNSTSSQ